MKVKQFLLSAKWSLIFEIPGYFPLCFFTRAFSKTPFFTRGCCPPLFPYRAILSLLSLSFRLCVASASFADFPAATFTPSLSLFLSISRLDGTTGKRTFCLESTSTRSSVILMKIIFLLDAPCVIKISRLTLSLSLSLSVSHRKIFPATENYFLRDISYANDSSLLSSSLRFDCAILSISPRCCRSRSGEMEEERREKRKKSRREGGTRKRERERGKLRRAYTRDISYSGKISPRVSAKQELFGNSRIRKFPSPRKHRIPQDPCLRTRSFYVFLKKATTPAEAFRVIFEFET